MSQDEDFLQAIIDNPDDDSIRLVFADWLEEQGDPRAEFIRVQCELAKLWQSDPRRISLEDRERRLLQEHEQQWQGPLRGQVLRCTFDRGFVEEVTVTVQTYLEKAPALTRLVPIRELVVDLTDAEISPEIIELVPESLARECRFLPLAARNGQMIVAMADPRSLDTIQMIEFALAQKIVAVAAGMEQIVEAIGRHYGVEGCPLVFVSKAIDFGSPEDDSSPLARLIDLIVREAFSVGATEIRIEPEEDRLVIQYRIKHELVERDSPPWGLKDAIRLRIRLIADMKNEETGRIRMTLEGKTIDMAVTFLTTVHGTAVNIIW